MAINGLMINENWHNHGFKMWVDQVINKHFAPSIAKRFYGVLEVEKYNKKNKNIVKQLRDQKYIMEVYYTSKEGIHVYICDVFSAWTKEVIELRLLQYITDKVKTEQIGIDWGDKDGRVSEIIVSEKLATPLELGGESN